MLLHFYRFLGRHTPTFILKAFYKRRVRLGKEIACRENERFGETPLARPAGFVVWIHGASVGELASTRGIVTRLLATYPTLSVLLTSGTVASSRFVQPWLNDRCFHQFVPYDALGPVQKFLDHWKPDLTLWMESELWPTLLSQLHDQKKPVYLINGRMSLKSYNNWKKTGRDAKKLLSVFRGIFAQSTAHQERFQALGATCIHNFGNLKLVGTPLDTDTTVQDSIKRHLGTRPWFMVASTHKGEEEHMYQAYGLIKKTYLTVCMVVAPRHSERTQAIKCMAEEKGLTVGLYSEGLQSMAHCDVFIIDCMGLLGTFYAMQPIVVMGGTFVPVGGHNFIEAYQLGAMVITGPHMHKQIELTSFFKAANCLITVTSAEDLATNIIYYLNHEDKRQAIVAQAQHVLTQHHHLLDELFSTLAAHLPHDM